MARTLLRAALPALLLALSACPKKETPPQPSEQPAPLPHPPTLPIGMTDPFPRLSTAAAQALDRGYKALRAKRPEEAAAAFAEVVAVAPDHTGARYQQARALAQAGKWKEARRQIEELLARDFVAFVGRTDRGKEWNALRESPEGMELKSAEWRYRKAYAEGLHRGLLFVARGRPARAPAAGADRRLELHQEVYHYDPATGRYRRLTSSGGQVYAALRSADGKTLAFLLAGQLRKGEGGDLFVNPQGGFVDLASLDTAGPFKLEGAFHQISLGFAPGGPAWIVETAPGVAGGTFMVDTARSGLARVADLPLPERVWATAQKVWHAGQGGPEGVTLSKDLRGFTVPGGGVVTAARELSASSLEWSPGRKRITYAGKLDACRVLSRGEQGAHNELFVYDAEKKSAQRIDSGVSEFAALWLDDNLLAYDNGVGARGTVNLYDLQGHRKTQLAPRHGAGLYGVPGLRCDAPAPAEEPEPAEAPPEE